MTCELQEKPAVHSGHDQHPGVKTGNLSVFLPPLLFVWFDLPSKGITFSLVNLLLCLCVIDWVLKRIYVLVSWDQLSTIIYYFCLFIVECNLYFHTYFVSGWCGMVTHKCNGKTKSHGKTNFNSRHNQINLQSNETSRQNTINSRQNKISSRQNTINSRQNNINSRQNTINSWQNTIHSLQNKFYHFTRRRRSHEIAQRWRKSLHDLSSTRKVRSSDNTRISLVFLHV